MLAGETRHGTRHHHHCYEFSAISVILLFSKTASTSLKRAIHSVSCTCTVVLCIHSFIHSSISIQHPATCNHSSTHHHMMKSNNTGANTSTPVSMTVSPPSDDAAQEDDEWDQFVDTPEEEEEDELEELHRPQPLLNVTFDRSSSTSSFPQFPPQLHPAVSLGVQRISSCYFSIQREDSTNTSIADLLSLLDNTNTNNSNNNNKNLAADDEDEADDPHQDASNVLYHDILMHVFTFLNAQSLAIFSQTSRRPNFEVFYYLQLQLQRSLIVDRSTFTAPVLHTPVTSSFGGSACVSRLVSLRPAEAQQIVLEFGNSNSTLRTMPLSHSLAYIRHVLQRGLEQSQQPHPPARALAGAAFLVTVLGAAFLGGAGAGASAVDAGASAGASASEAAFDSFGTELPNMLFRVGFMGGLMGAASKMSEKSGEMAQRLPASFWNQVQKLERDAEKDHPSLARLMHALSTMMPLPLPIPNTADSKDPTQQPWTPNPYEHLPSNSDAAAKEKKEDLHQLSSTVIDKKMPSGCVGAYSRAITKAANGVTQHVKDQRQVKFDALSTDEQYQLSSHFLDACMSNETLPIVKQMIHAINVDGFFFGSDGGTETCALHTAAFHGAHKVLDFLCQSINASDPSQDGGLADVNIKDTNGWTALHFAAGANSFEAVQILVQHGAELTIEANNGYTPLQWAQRLSNVRVAEELREHMAGAESPGWMSSQPLSMIANRFFSLIPTH
jgi:hypothetical protein